MHRKMGAFFVRFVRFTSTFLYSVIQNQSRYKPTYPPMTLSNIQWDNQKNNVNGKMCTTILSVLFLVWFQPKSIMYLFIEHLFELNIGIHPSNTGEKLVYYHLYPEEASFYLGVCIQLFNRPFLVINTNTIFIHLGLISQ